MFETITVLVVSLSVLIWSAGKLVYGSAAIAKNAGIPPLIIGMSIIAMGSSAPEMVVSIQAALSGKSDTAVGNVLGSNIANIALILGCTALIHPLSISSSILRRELPLMLGVTLIAGAILWDSYLGFFEGILLALLLGVFLLIMVKFTKDANKDGKKDPMLREKETEVSKDVGNVIAIFWVIVGLVFLIYSADKVVESAVTIAKTFGMSDLMIGLTIVAIGTSLPELATSLASVIKGEDDLAVGNIVGSNIFNILAVMGLPAILSPSELNPLAMERDFYVMLGVSVLLFLFAVGKARTINRSEGITLLLCFIGYQGYLLTHIAV